MSLYVGFKGAGYPFIVSLGRNPSQPSPIEEDTEEGDVEMASETSESTISNAESEATSQVQSAAQSVFGFSMPQVSFSPAVGVSLATGQLPAAVRVPVKDKPIVQARAPWPNFKYTKKFMDNLAGQSFYCFKYQRREEVTLDQIDYKHEFAMVRTRNPLVSPFPVKLFKLKRISSVEKYLLVRQNDGNYALGSYPLQGQQKTITWVGSNEEDSLSLEGDDNLARFIPVSQETLDRCFSKIENAYRVSSYSNQLIPAYKLKL